MLYVSGGVLWLSDARGKNNIKLIDADNIVKAAYSQDKKFIAYTVEVPVKEMVVEHDGTSREVEVTKKQLLLADARGTNSFLVKDGVERWGWIPNTNLLWYETASLKSVFYWKFWGDSNIWVFNIKNRKANLLVQAGDKKSTWKLLNPQWSPDGTKVSFVSLINGATLEIVDRIKGTRKRLFSIPYVGGDRGGPPPIPTFVWNSDSQEIYTALTPLLFERDDSFQEFSKRFKSGYLSAWRIPVDGSPPKELLTQAPSIYFSDETCPKLAFNKDFTKMVYPRYSQDNIENLSFSEWMRMWSETKLIPSVKLVIFDLEKKKEAILLEDISNFIRVRDKRIHRCDLFFGKDALYGLFRFREDINKSAIKKIDFKTGKSSLLDILSANERSYVDNAKFLPDRDILYFTYSNRFLVLVDDKLVLLSDDPVTFVNYYLDEF